MIELTDENFEQEIQNAEKPVMVDFWAEGCGPCSIFTPILEKVANEFKEKLIFAKANLNLTPIIAKKYGIDRIPMVILFKNGKPVSGFVGVRPEPVVKELLDKMLKENENKNEKVEELIKEYEEYAEKNGFKLNPNREVVERLIKGMLENEKKFGFQYCPCRRVTGNREEDKKKICPCDFMQNEIKEQGHCLCGLFMRERLEYKPLD